MKTQTSLIYFLMVSLILTACVPAQATAIPTKAPTETTTPSPTLTVTPVPTATSTSTATVTPTSTLTPIPLPVLKKEYTNEYGTYQFQFPEGWDVFDKYGSTFVMPEEYANILRAYPSEWTDIITIITGYRIDWMGDLFTDPRAIEEPEDVLALIPRSTRYDAALESGSGEPITIESNGHPVYEITARGEDGYWYTAIFLAKELGLAARVLGYTTAENWEDTQPFFMAMARSMILHELPPIEQLDPSLEDFMLPEGPDEFALEPYVNVPYGFQIPYPEGWTVLKNDEMTVFSPDRDHTLCYYVLDIDPDQCGTPVVVVAFTQPKVMDFFRQASFEEPGDEDEIWEYFDQLTLNFGPTYYDFGPIERFEVNGYPAIGLQYWGSYSSDYDFDSPWNPVMGYILAVQGGDRAAVFLSMAPSRFWCQFRPLFASMLERFTFTAGLLPPTPTPTITPTLIPAPVYETPTANHFTFNGMELEIQGAALADDCGEAYQKIKPDPGGYIFSPVFEVDQPAGTKCLLVVVSSLPGTEYDFDRFSQILNAGVADQAQEHYPIVLPGETLIGTSFGEGIKGLSTDLYVFVDETSTTFTFILPDGRKIPIRLD